MLMITPSSFTLFVGLSLLLAIYMRSTILSSISYPLLFLHRDNSASASYIPPEALSAAQQDTVLANKDGVYSSSTTPAHLPWNTYNYCNAPHIKPSHYVLPSPVGESTSEPKLLHVTIFMRHHKRTPDNLYPSENALNAQEWDCSSFHQFNYGAIEGVSQGRAVWHETNTPDWHPFISSVWNGSCAPGQLTQGGFEDAMAHGRDLYSVYGPDKLGLLSSSNEEEVYLRTSNSDRTFQVASALLRAFSPSPNTNGSSWRAHTQPSNIDSLVPSYPCPRADSLRGEINSSPTFQEHLKNNSAVAERLGNLLGTRGMTGWENWFDKYFDSFTSRTCAGVKLPCNTTRGECVSEGDARTVFQAGDWEYNYIWNEAARAKEYSKLGFSVMFQELVLLFQSIKRGEESHKLRLYIGHDGSMIRLLSVLDFPSPIRWPALGSEVAMEVWVHGGKKFVRVLFNGEVVKGFEWMNLEEWIGRLEGGVVDGLSKVCYE
ncbi:phosphoglycerate mutase-like protein [Atractiella rhizophila]|nr:phosphoglycerate mutase-like protein [Atractiella rhizophila]